LALVNLLATFTLRIKREQRSPRRLIRTSSTYNN